MKNRIAEIDTSLNLFKAVLKKGKGRLGEHEIVLKYLIEELSSKKGGLKTQEESKIIIKELEQYLRSCIKEGIRPNISYICEELSISRSSYYNYLKSINTDEPLTKKKEPLKKYSKKKRRSKTSIPILDYFKEVATRKSKPKKKGK